MTQTLIAENHFDGGAALTAKPGGADDRKLSQVLRALQTAANNGSQETVKQAVAATAAGVAAFIAPAAGAITSVRAFAGAGAASGESLTVDVKINGVTCLTGVITLGATEGTDVQSGTLAAAVALAAGDKVTVDFAYTAGGGPTPIVNTVVTIGFNLS